MKMNKNMELKVVTKLSSPAEIKKHLGQKGYFFHCLEDLKNCIDLTAIPFTFGTFTNYEYGSYLPIVANIESVSLNLHFFGFIPESEIQRLVDSINVEEPEKEKDYKKLYERYFHLCYREKMIEGNEKLQIYKNAVDEFIKRHPEFNEELNEIIKQEEEESEEAEED